MFQTNLISASAVGASEVVFTVLFALFSLLVVLVAVWLFAKFMPKKTAASVGGMTETEPQKPVELNFTAVMAICLLLGLIVRLIFAFVVRGDRGEFNLLVTLMKTISDNGIVSGFYNSGTNGIFPLSYLIYGVMGGLSSLFGVDAASAVMPLFVKLPLILCDLATAFVLYRAARKYMNGYVALIVCAFFCICPVFVFSSAVWGSLYSILTFLLVLCMYFITQKNFIAIIGVYGAAMLVMPDALYLFPLVAVYVIYHFIKSVKNVKSLQPKGFKALLSDRECAGVFTIPVAIVLANILMYVVSLPSIAESIGAGYFNWLYVFFLQPLGKMASFGKNSLGIFNIFMRNGVALDAEFPTVVFTVIFGVIITGIVLLIYLSKRNRANLVFLGGYVLFTLATYFVNFSALSLVPVLGIFLLAYIFIRDKRILQIFGVLSLAVVLNACFALCGSGYLSASASVGVSAEVLNSGAGLAGNIVCSVLAVLTHLYATLLLLDISMSSKRKLLPESERIGFIKALAGFFKI